MNTVIKRAFGSVTFKVENRRNENRQVLEPIIQKHVHKGTLQIHYTITSILYYLVNINIDATKTFSILWRHKIELNLQIIFVCKGDLLEKLSQTFAEERLVVMTLIAIETLSSILAMLVLWEEPDNW